MGLTLADEPEPPRDPKRNVADVLTEEAADKGVVGGRKMARELQLCEPASAGETRNDAPPPPPLGQRLHVPVLLSVGAADRGHLLC